MLKTGEYSLIFISGFWGYCLIELLWRGHTHWTMGLAGGVCFLFFHMLNRKYSSLRNFYKFILGSLIITGVELIIGSIINLGLGWQVWDYSRHFLNFRGQICLIYSLLWYFLCIFLAWYSKFLSCKYYRLLMKAPWANIIELPPY